MELRIENKFGVYGSGSGPSQNLGSPLHQVGKVLLEEGLAADSPKSLAGAPRGRGCGSGLGPDRVGEAGREGGQEDDDDGSEGAGEVHVVCQNLKKGKKLRSVSSWLEF